LLETEEIAEEGLDKSRDLYNLPRIQDLWNIPTFVV
jgi:hypothetical protein